VIERRFIFRPFFGAFEFFSEIGEESLGVVGVYVSYNQPHRPPKEWLQIDVSDEKLSVGMPQRMPVTVVAPPALRVLRLAADLARLRPFVRHRFGTTHGANCLYVVEVFVGVHHLDASRFVAAVTRRPSGLAFCFVGFSAGALEALVAIDWRCGPEVPHGSGLLALPAGMRCRSDTDFRAQRFAALALVTSDSVCRAVPIPLRALAGGDGGSALAAGRGSL